MYASCRVLGSSIINPEGGSAVQDSMSTERFAQYIDPVYSHRLRRTGHDRDDVRCYDFRDAPGTESVSVTVIGYAKQPVVST